MGYQFGNASVFEIIWTGFGAIVAIYIGRLAFIAFREMLIVLSTSDSEYDGDAALYRVTAVEYAVMFWGMLLLVMPDLLLGVNAMTVPSRADPGEVSTAQTVQVVIFLARQAWFALMAFGLELMRTYKVALSRKSAPGRRDEE